MSRIVRQTLTVGDRPRRSLDERLATLFPKLGWRLAALLFRLPPASSIRRRFVATLVKRGYAALNRGDFDLNARVLYGEDSELVVRGNFPLGPGSFRGPESIARGYLEWTEMWVGHRRLPRQVFDLGDKLVVDLDGVGRGAASGVPVSQRFVDVITVRRGRILLHEVFPDRQAGMRAAGLTNEAMSRENEQTVRRWLEAMSSEDFDAALGLVHPAVVLVPPGKQAPYRGAESLRRWLEPDAFQDQVVKTLETVIVTGRTILSRQNVTARGRASGIELDVISWCVWTFDENGLITRIEIYLDHDEDKAREAAGLSE